MATKALSLVLFSTLFSGVFLLSENIVNFHISQDQMANIWAVLVAGSDTWDNYRHQADVCHSYQVLHNHGIPDERIVVMMKDDLAGDPSNPTPGIVINHPNGKDVYKGVPHDYIGDDVTPENFMSVLKGDKQALKGIGSGKVIESGPNDHVFVFFADHGAPGLIAFPESELTAKQLNKTINFMHKNKKYNKLVFYIEACESGSMFKNLLPKNINVFATTAANSLESSYACYFDDDRQTYLGDVYSVNWMEDSDKEVLTSETLSQQFKIVKKETNTSHVTEFGDLTIGKMHVSEFQGRKNAQPITVPKVPKNPVRSGDVSLKILEHKISRANSNGEYTELKKKYVKMLRNRKFLEERVLAIVRELLKNEVHPPNVFEKAYDVIPFDCYDEARQYFQEECFKISKNSFALNYMHVLINLCDYGMKPITMKEAMEKVCTHPPVYGIV